MIWGLGLWHENEPADEFTEIYSTLLDGDELPDAFAAEAPSAADRAIMAKELFAAIWSGEPDRVRPLLARVPELAVEVDDAGRTPLHVAVENHYWAEQTREIALALIAVAPDVNARDEYGNTPLHEAALRDPALVRALLDRGADRSITDARGRTALEAATDHSQQQPTLRGEAVRACIQLLEARA